MIVDFRDWPPGRVVFREQDGTTLTCHHCYFVGARLQHIPGRLIHTAEWEPLTERTYRLKGGRTCPVKSLRDVLQGLAQKWKWETATMSFLVDRLEHPAYQAIIALGWDVVPLLLQALQREPEHWGYALHCITGASPVPDSAAGNCVLIAEAWITWGKQERYLLPIAPEGPDPSP